MIVTKRKPYQSRYFDLGLIEDAFPAGGVASGQDCRGADWGFGRAKRGLELECGALDRPPRSGDGVPVSVLGERPVEDQAQVQGWRQELQKIRKRNGSLSTEQWRSKVRGKPGAQGLHDER
ncbi:MAG: hypothetical protein AAF668_05070 [Pseudomonadota bacterium]